MEFAVEFNFPLLKFSTIELYFIILFRWAPINPRFAEYLRLVVYPCLDYVLSVFQVLLGSLD